MAAEAMKLPLTDQNAIKCLAKTASGAEWDNSASKRLISLKKEENGAQGQNRTADTGIFSPLLYQLSYLGAVGLRGAEAVLIGNRAPPV